MGERRCREDVQELEEMMIEMKRAESLQSVGSEVTEEAASMKDETMVDKILRTQVSFTDEDNEKITVVQVGQGDVRPAYKKQNTNEGNKGVLKGKLGGNNAAASQVERQDTGNKGNNNKGGKGGKKGN